MPDKRASRVSGMHKICATDSAVAPLPDSLTRAATPFRIAEVRQARALGIPAPCRKTEPSTATTVHNINWINRMIRRHPMALSIPALTGPIYRGLTTTMSPVSLGWTQRPPGGLCSDAISCGRPSRSKADETSISRLTCQLPKPTRNPHGRSGGLRG